jgi:hypothetical protein
MIPRETDDANVLASRARVKRQPRDPARRLLEGAFLRSLSRRELGARGRAGGVLELEPEVGSRPVVVKPERDEM